MKEKVIKELKSWGVILIIFGGLYITGLHTEVFGFLQRILVSTGIVNADTEVEHLGYTDYKWQVAEFKSGEKINFDEFKGKTVFLNIWASWCPPCIAEMPSIEGLYQKLKDKDDVVFVILNVDEDKSKAEKFLKRKDFSFPVYSRNAPTPPIFQSRSIPTTFVINKEGEIIFKHTGLANYDTDDFVKMLSSN
ncbi:TlpA family protein disulfide reductase [Flammeovirga pacifica]|uniref:Thioredoxin domain-containing protein n=1 Tax=Flammeovirga pacifica TaxID=915059 RepID=A0A1S1Z2I0_FLAPC|nr:TlpA disulfide reductase family protein [Flammeovirga pacifica]OHX67315.1 hypothetical protein NH26_13665 [Flammeovirga pacifica]